MCVIYDAACHLRGRPIELERKFTRRGHLIRIWHVADGEIITIIEKLPPQGQFTKLLTGFKDRRAVWRGIHKELKNAKA